MSTDKELREKQYSSEFQRLRVNILYTARWMENQVKDFLKPHDLTPKQFNILRILRGHKGDIPLSVLEIRERMIDRMSDVSRLIDRMEKKNLISRKSCKSDGRTYRICITKLGLELLSEIDTKMNVLDDIFSGMDTTMAKNLNEGLNQFRKVH